MRVLLVNDYSVDDGYGAEAYVRRLASGLAAAGDAVELWAGEVSHEGASRWRDYWDPISRRRLAERIEEWHPDVVHFHNITRECSASVLSAGKRVGPIARVMTVHDFRMSGAQDTPGTGFNGAVRRWGARRSSRLVLREARRRLDATMAVSEPLAERLRRLGLPNVSVTGVPAADPTSATADVAACRDIAFVGRLTPDKGPELALSAFINLMNDWPSSRLLIAGDGAMAESLRATAAAAGDRIQLLGKLDEAGVSALLGRVRFLVVPSMPQRRPEGSPVVVAEAAAHGRPAIVSDDPGLRRSAERLGGAVIVPAGDTAALGAAMEQLLGDDQQVRTLGAAARSAMPKRAGIAAVTAQVRAVYRQAVEAARAK